MRDSRVGEEDSFPLLTLNPSLVNILTIGHKGLYSDFSYFWLLQSLIAKDEDEVRPSVEELTRKIRLVTRHLPNIESLYTLSCFIMISEYKEPKRCEAIAIEGMRALPKNWLIPSVVGYMFAFVIKDKARASFYYSKAGNVPGSPPYFSKLSKRLLSGELEKEDSAETLDAIIHGTEDEDYQEFLKQILKERKQN